MENRLRAFDFLHSGEEGFWHTIATSVLDTKLILSLEKGQADAIALCSIELNRYMYAWPTPVEK